MSNYNDDKLLAAAMMLCANPRVRAFVKECIEQAPLSLAALRYNDGHRYAAVACVSTDNDLSVALQRAGKSMAIHAQNPVFWLLDGANATNLSFPRPFRVFTPHYAYVSSLMGLPLKRGFVRSLIERFPVELGIRPYMFMVAREVLMLVFVDKHSASRFMRTFFERDVQSYPAFFIYGARHYVIDSDWRAAHVSDHYQRVSLTPSAHTRYEPPAAQLLDFTNTARVGPIVDVKDLEPSEAEFDSLLSIGGEDEPVAYQGLATTTLSSAREDSVSA